MVVAKNKLLALAAVVVALVAVGASAPLWSGHSYSSITRNLENLPVRLITRYVPPEAEERPQLNDLEGRALRRLDGRLDAWIVWSSNRFGNHEILGIDTGRGEVRRLTDHPHVDYFPRFSPDGDRILFLRSQRPWVSQRETDAWDLWVMNADGSGQRRVARGAFRPTWHPDGESILFRRGFTVHRVELESGEETVFFAPGDDLPGHGIGDIDLSSDGSRLAMNVFGQGVGYYELDSKEFTFLGWAGHSCEPAWGVDDRFLVWVEIGRGNGDTLIVRGRPGTTREDSRILIDLPGEYSHEYFPRLSDDGRWLVWGASAGGHEHDRADYEIFLWRLDTAWEKAIRLSFYEGNDSWPDIHVKSP